MIHLRESCPRLLRHHQRRNRRNRRCVKGHHGHLLLFGRHRGEFLTVGGPRAVVAIGLFSWRGFFRDVRHLVLARLLHLRCTGRLSLLNSQLEGLRFGSLLLMVHRHVLHLHHINSHGVATEHHHRWRQHWNHIATCWSPWSPRPLWCSFPGRPPSLGQGGEFIETRLCIARLHGHIPNGQSANPVAWFAAQGLLRHDALGGVRASVLGEGTFAELQLRALIASVKFLILCTRKSKHLLQLPQQQLPLFHHDLQRRHFLRRRRRRQRRLGEGTPQVIPLDLLDGTES
mmetsp:Transcript_88287/g.140410  ORF Transcript_88287/g.140410 Transcript_88287/m.140410 type:complete len:287 (+) Transcript_88287:203-1063(+)